MLLTCSTHPPAPSEEGVVVAMIVLCWRPTPFVPLRGGGGCCNVCTVLETHPLWPLPARMYFKIQWQVGRQALLGGGNLIQLELPLLGGGWGVGDDAGLIVLMQLDPVGNGSHHFTQVCFDILVFKPQKSYIK